MTVTALSQINYKIKPPISVFTLQLRPHQSFWADWK